MFHVSPHIFLQPTDVAGLVCCLLTTTGGWSHPTACLVYGLVLLLEIITGFVMIIYTWNGSSPTLFAVFQD
jgi:hypothetical protein